MPGTRGLRAQQSPPENLTGLEGGREGEREGGESAPQRAPQDPAQRLSVGPSDPWN